MKQVLRSAATAGLATEAGFARGLAGLARSTTGAACTTGVASCDVSFVVLFAVFFADFLTAFLAAFFAAFLGAFFATLPAVFFDALPAFFTTRLCLAAPFLAARFFAAFLPVRADGDLLTFFALRFFEAFFPAFATTNSFLTQRYQGLFVGRSVTASLPRASRTPRKPAVFAPDYRIRCRARRGRSFPIPLPAVQGGADWRWRRRSSAARPPNARCCRGSSPAPPGRWCRAHRPAHAARPD